MKVHVEAVTRVSNGLEIRFKHPLFGLDGTLNQMGMHIMRILRIHASTAPISGRDTGDHFLLIETNKTIKQLSTLKAAQSEMDRFTRHQIKVRFHEVKVAQESHPLKTPLAVEQALAQNKKVDAMMPFSLNLPVLPEDAKRLEQALKSAGIKIGRPNYDSCTLLAYISLQGNPDEKNPWAILHNLKPKIRAALI